MTEKEQIAAEIHHLITGCVSNYTPENQHAHKLLQKALDFIDKMPEKNMKQEERKCYKQGVTDAIEKAIVWIRRNEENGGCVFDGWEDCFKKEISKSL